MKISKIAPTAKLYSLFDNRDRSEISSKAINTILRRDQECDSAIIQSHFPATSKSAQVGEENLFIKFVERIIAYQSKAFSLYNPEQRFKLKRDEFVEKAETLIASSGYQFV